MLDYKKIGESGGIVKYSYTIEGNPAYTGTIEFDPKSKKYKMLDHIGDPYYSRCAGNLFQALTEQAESGKIPNYGHIAWG